MFLFPFGLQTPNTEDLWIDELMTNAFVFVVATTMLYLAHVYVIPTVFIQFGDTPVLLMKVSTQVLLLCIFLYTGIMPQVISETS